MRPHFRKRRKLRAEYRSATHSSAARAEHLRQRVRSYRQAPVGIERDALTQEFVPELRLVVFKIRGDHRDLPVTVSLRLYQAEDLRGRCRGFFRRRPRSTDCDPLRGPGAGRAVIPQEMLLQEGKGRRLGETVLFPQKQVFPAGDGEICSEPGDLLRHLRTHAEQVLRRRDPVRIRVRADGDRKTKLCCQGQQGPDDPVLDRRKAGEAVQKKHCVPDQPALRKIPAQHGQQLLRRDPV